MTNNNQTEKYLKEKEIDTSGLTITENSGRVEAVTGAAMYHGVLFAVSIIPTKENPKVVYTPAITRGTVSLRDPETGNVLVSEAKKNAGKDHDKCLARAEIKCYHDEPNNVGEAIYIKIKKLYDENKDQLLADIRTVYDADTITPIIASDTYLGEYISESYPKIKADKRKRKEANIISVCRKLPNRPMSKITDKDIENIRKTENLTGAKYSEIKKFWMYCISHNICGGILPFSHKERSLSFEALDKKAVQLTCMSFTVWLEMIKCLFKCSYTAVGCGIFLMMSGFNLDFIMNVKWKDLEIKKDAVFVEYYRPYVAAAIHNFSRDLFQDAARYLYEYYTRLKTEIQNNEKMKNEDVDEQYILSYYNTQTEKWERYPKEKLTTEAKKLLNNAKIKNDLVDRGEKIQEPISTSIIQDSYGYFLKTKCGLENDPDTWHFLNGQVMKSSTYTNYESHTDSTARKRFRQIMQPLSITSKNNKTRKITITNRKKKITYLPERSNQRVAIDGTITLQPGQTVSFEYAV